MVKCFVFFHSGTVRAMIICNTASLAYSTMQLHDTSQAEQDFPDASQVLLHKSNKIKLPIL
jgi:hypothetical protein